MSRITFFIGNGFDLNVGLNTQYREFYAHYIKKYPDDMLAKNIGQNYNYWSDLESGLGQYTGKINIEDAEAFWKSEINLEKELIAYLKAQMRRVNIKDVGCGLGVSTEMQRSLTAYTKELPDSFQSHIEEVLYNIKENITYSFISFNYTDTFDKCLDVTKRILNGSVGVNCCSDSLLYQYFIGEVLHIHGTTDREMVLGVNDEAQVSNKEFIQNDLYRKYIIKEEANKHYNNGKIEEARMIIEESIIICVFGMSIGKTDKLWWKYLCEWLWYDKKRRLILYVKANPKERFSMFAMGNKALESLRINADISKNMWNQIKNQIYVNCDTRIFRFKIVDN